MKLANIISECETLIFFFCRWETWSKAWQQRELQHPPPPKAKPLAPKPPVTKTGDKKTSIWHF